MEPSTVAAANLESLINLGKIFLAIICVAGLLIVILSRIGDKYEDKRHAALKKERQHQYQELLKRFRPIGNMSGMHRNSIIKIVGEPSNISTDYYGTLVTWGHYTQ